MLSDVLMSNPLNRSHWQARGCVLWLKGLSSLRGLVWHDLSDCRNNIQMVNASGWIGRGKGLSWNCNSAISVLGQTIKGHPTGSSPRTLMCWYRLRVASSGNQQIVAYGTYATGQTFSIHSGLNTIGLLSGNAMALTSMPADLLWHHIAVVFPINATQTQSALIYLDGRLRSITSTSAPTTVVNTTGSNFRVGNVASTATNFPFSGDIDDIRLYNYAMSADQIRTVYQDSASERYEPFNQSSIVNMQGRYGFESTQFYSPFQPMHLPLPLRRGAII